MLAKVASRIDIDVLILAGADDHFVPLNQVDEGKEALTHARSVTGVVFDRASEDSQHCQIGALSLWPAAIFEWLEAKFATDH